MNFSKMKLSKLKEMAVELNVYPEEGSGAGGAVIKKDLVAALTGGAGDIEIAPAPVPVSQLDPNEKYLFDHAYEVVTPFRGYEPGDEVSNLPRALGQELLDQGAIKFKKGSPVRSNPLASPRPRKAARAA